MISEAAQMKVLGWMLVGISVVLVFLGIWMVETLI